MTQVLRDQWARRVSKVALVSKGHLVHKGPEVYMDGEVLQETLVCKGAQDLLGLGANQAKLELMDSQVLQ